MKSWSVSLSALWGVESLPEVVCETQVHPLGPLGRVTAQGEGAAQSPWFFLDSPMKLVVHREPKPWGFEVWYTGVEKRGVCAVECGSNATVSLPAYLSLGSALSHETEGSKIKVPLLKILAPHASAASGCLYIEVHQEKWETYFISAVDRSVWPDGRGQVLFGFSTKKMAAFAGNEMQFKTALLADVRAYEAVRNQIDDAYVDSDTLRTKEKELWQRVRDYFDFLDVGVGDIVRVPPLTPHSLQHGVEVVEFQTPTYERLILAFNQKVLTQNHWDTEKAVELAHFRSGRELNRELSSVGCVADGEWSLAVDFPEFRVQQISLTQKRSSCSIPSFESACAVLFVLSGEVELRFADGASALTLTSGEAALVPNRGRAPHVTTVSRLGESKLLWV